VDFIVEVKPRDYRRILSVAERAGLGIDRQRVLAGLKAGFNLIQLRDKSSPYQADFILQEGRLERRQGSLLGLKTYYQTPERLVLAKLRMVKATRPLERSLKDREDVQAIIRDTQVDRRRIARLARSESTLEIFRELLKETRQLKAQSSDEGKRTRRSYGTLVKRSREARKNPKTLIPLDGRSSGRIGLRGRRL